uniref:Uncharacterized protein n=1 Tax=Medicago truncatula TaxID=3880 RepID=I3SLW3_MEDTR|nr:unknown [Medicago truncatula]
MDTQQRSPLLSWAYYYQGKSMDELKQTLMYTTMELEQTRVTVQEELRKRDEQLHNLKELFNKVIRERDEAQEKCQRLFLEKLLFQQQKQQNQDPLSGISSIEDEQIQKRGIESSNNGISLSDCEESIVSSPQQTRTEQPMMMMIDSIAKDKPLPEKGKLLQAVMKAGPLLQTLLLADHYLNGDIHHNHHSTSINYFLKSPLLTVTVEDSIVGKGFFVKVLILLLQRISTRGLYSIDYQVPSTVTIDFIQQVLEDFIIVYSEPSDLKLTIEIACNEQLNPILPT